MLVAHKEPPREVLTCYDSFIHTYLTRTGCIQSVSNFLKQVILNPAVVIIQETAIMTDDFLSSHVQLYHLSGSFIKSCTEVLVIKHQQFIGFLNGPFIFLLLKRQLW